MTTKHIHAQDLRVGDVIVYNNYSDKYRHHGVVESIRTVVTEGNTRIHWTMRLYNKDETYMQRQVDERNAGQILTIERESA